MSEFTIIKSLPGEEAHPLFLDLPKRLYSEPSPRFRLGNDPVTTYLEGCYTLFQNNEPAGRFAFYENPELIFNGHKAACIGSYECVDEGETSLYLISYAKELARNKDYKWLIGPMEGSTWNNYRFSMHNDEPNFFMEPYHHAYYNSQFTASGFQIISEYTSNLDVELSFDAERLEKFEKHYIKKGAIFRNLNLDDFESDLKKIAALSLEGFSSNFLYSPISAEGFVAKYAQLKTYFDPSLVWLVEDKDADLHAFIFCINDYMNPSHKAMIIKSMVRKQDSPFKGIGSYLASKTIQIAKEKGYEKTIHALMIKDNSSVQISEKHAGKPYKSYALYGLEL